MRTDTATYLQTPVTLPPAGGRFRDEAFDTEIMRVTDENDKGNQARTESGSFGTTYAVWPTGNIDNTRLWIFNARHNNYWIANMHPTTGDRVGPLELVANPPARLFSHQEAAFWAKLDPDKIFVTVDAKIYYYRPSTRTYHLVKDLTTNFPSGVYFNQLYVGADDTRFAALMKVSGPSSVIDVGFMVYDSKEDRVVLDVRVSDVNGISMLRSGKYVLLEPDIDPNQYVYNVDTGAVETLIFGPPDYEVGHNDCGNDIVAGDDRWQGRISVRKLSSPHEIETAWQYSSTGNWVSHHVSMTALNDNWALISIYAVPVGDPNKFKNECLQVGVRAPYLGQLRRHCHTRADMGNDYWSSPRANMSFDGQYIYFTSNNGVVGGRNDLYRAKIEPAPGGMMEPAPAPSPVPAPAPQPAPVPTPSPSAPTPTSPKTPSPDGTKGRMVVDSQGATWTIPGDDMNKSGPALKDGVVFDSGAGFEYKYWSGVVYLRGTDGKTWYKATASSWVEVGAQEPGGTAAPAPVTQPVPAPTTPEVRKVPWPTTETKQNAVVEAQWKEKFRFKRHLSGAFVEFERVN